MKARGYGIRKRSFAHSFKFRAWDGIFVAAFAVIFALVLIFSAKGELSAAFYPVIKLENSVFLWECSHYYAFSRLFLK